MTRETKKTIKSREYETGRAAIEKEEGGGRRKT